MSLDPIILNELQRGGPPLWVADRSYRAGQCVLAPSDWQVYMRSVAGAGAVDPKNDPGHWVRWGAAIEAAVALVGAAVTGVGEGVSALGPIVAAINAKADAIGVNLGDVKAGTGIKPIQRGLAEPTLASGSTGVLDVTVSAVNLAKAVVIVSTWVRDGQTATHSGVLARLTSATNLRLTCGPSATTGTSRFASVEWQILEFV